MTGESRYTIEQLAVPDSLEELHTLLERIGSEHPEVDAADLMMFETAVIEIAGNVIEHGTPAGQVVFVFVFTVEEDRLECRLRDTSVRPLPETGTSPMPQDPTEEDGRGLALAHAVLDRLESHHADGVNHWTLVRNRR